MDGKPINYRLISLILGIGLIITMGLALWGNSINRQLLDVCRQQRDVINTLFDRVDLPDLNIY